MGFHRHKITIIVKQSVAMFDAEGADDDVDCLTDRDAPVSQHAIIPCRSRSELAVQHRHDSIHAQFALDTRRMEFVASTLQDFEQDEIADQKCVLCPLRFPAFRSLAFDCRASGRSKPSCRPESQWVEPATFAHLIQVSLPPQSFEIGEGSDLVAHPNEQTQAFFYRGTFGRQARCRHGLGQQLIVNFDIGPHHSLSEQCVLFMYSIHIDEVAQLRPDCQFEAACKGQGHGAEAVRRLVDEGEIVRVVVAILLGVVADHDGARPQMRRDQLDRRPRHLGPDVHQHEVDRAVDELERLAQVAFAQVDEAARPASAKWARAAAALAGSYSVPITTPAAGGLSRTAAAR